MADKKKTELSQYQQSKPMQLEMFELLGQGLENYSNTIELYDVMPKYHFGGVEREKGKTTEALPVLSRNFFYRNKEYKLGVSPAAIVNKEGKTIHYYLSQREELVEDVIRKLATRRRALYLDDEAGVKFTLYEVREELKKIGHGYSISEIKKAIEICNKAVIEITSKDGNEVAISSNVFPFVGMEKKEMDGGKNKVIVTFHHLVTRSINQGTFRLINYDKVMPLKMPLARWIYKRISHLFLQATISSPYTIKLSTIVRDSGMKSYKNMYDRIKQVSDAIEELKSCGTVSKFNVIKEQHKNKVLDATFELFFSEEFVADVKKANKLANQRIEGKGIEESFNIEELRSEIEKPIYGLTKTVINNLLLKIKTKEVYDDIVNSLKAALDYMSVMTQQKKSFVAGAITQKAIKDGWKPTENANIVEKEAVAKVLKENTEDGLQKKRREEERKKSVEKFQNQWLKIIDVMREEYGEDIFRKWFAALQLYSYFEDEVVLQVETKFVRDWLTREFLEKKAAQNLLQLCQLINPKILKVKIVALEDC